MNVCAFPKCILISSTLWSHFQTFLQIPEGYKHLYFFLIYKIKIRSSPNARSLGANSKDEKIYAKMRRIGNTRDPMNTLHYICVSYHFSPVSFKKPPTFRRYFAGLANITLLKCFISQHEEQVFSDILPPKSMVSATKDCGKGRTEAALPG